MRYHKQAMVVAPQPEAAEVAAEIMRAGGNAVDAAVACALVQGVVDPLMCGIAGFGSCGIAMTETGFHGYVDFHAPAPLGARPDMWASLVESEARDGYSFVVRGRLNDVGYQSIAVPASLRGYCDAHREHGKLPWAQVVEPAVGYAEDGWVVRPDVTSFWSSDGEMGRVPNHERLKLTPSPRALYCRPDGTPKQVGDRVRNRDLGSTLRLIGEHGDAVFYEGEIAHAIAEDMRTNGGLLALADLQRYRTIRNAPLWGAYRGYRVSTNRPPGGGLMLLQMLNVLAHFDLRQTEHNEAAYIRIVAEAMKCATRDKDRYVGDPAFVSAPLDWLLSDEYAAELAGEIRSGRKADVPRFNAGSGPGEHTTHVSVIDAAGNCVTMTHSLGMPSGVITDGLGFMYNGCMSAFDPRPGRAGSIAPGKARFSAIAPSIVYLGDRPHLIIGAPGATLIANGVLQVLLNAFDFGMTMTEAVSAPRFSATSNAIDVSNRIPRGVQRELEAMGYEVIRSPWSFAAAAVHAIRVHPDGLDGGADPGMDGMVLTV
jgi:gamma-glutamyltranspeptidase / glutathione hydrolase